MSYTSVGKPGTPGYMRIPKRNIMRNQPTVRKIAKQEANKAVRRLGETKFTDRTISASNISYDGTVFNILGLIDRGDAQNQFDGDMLRPVSLKYRILLRLPNSPTADAVNDSAFRMIIFQVRGNQVPTALDILALPGGAGGTSSPIADFNMDNKANFRVLSDRFYTLVAGQSDVIKVSATIRKMNKVRFVSTDTVAPLTYETGGLYCLFISDQTGVNTLPIRGFFRTQYKDN